MTVRVRFAPSPTGYLHIGGARTALFNYLFALATNGVFVLRIEDTDIERSTSEFEKLQLQDLEWLGIEPDEGPRRPGNVGPYRQSERLDIYQKYAKKLVDEGKAYYCFCSEEDLENRKNIAQEAGDHAAHYDGTCKKLSSDEVTKKLDQGHEAVIRFSVPAQSFRFDDKVRGSVEFPEDMVGDFVILRSSGMPVYNFCCVVDDWLMEITHVIRGEDHLNNTLRQLMIYDAFGAKYPEFAHVSLLVGSDRQKLSKRHGATSVTNYREEGYLPQAMVNYLCMLGWSHPDEKDIFTIDEIKSIFCQDRFTKAPALFDLEKFKWVNGQHLRDLSVDKLLEGISQNVPQDNVFHTQSEEWKREFVDLYKNKIDFFKEINDHLSDVFNESYSVNEELTEVFSWESTGLIKEYLNKEIELLAEQGAETISAEVFTSWESHIKKEMKIKGKQLFKGVRAVLTGAGHGADLKRLIPLTPIKVIQERLKRI